MIEVHRSDLEKILDVLTIAAAHHVARDEMNAALHLAKAARYSPLTSELLAERDRVTELLKVTS
jgi:hypothetical protein